ncbi:MAG: hypothetical protein P4L42_02755 [Desulfocapsaceae bacterium]|nr:hypothetical protein [Desulfocapsaceae bacterium]
MEQHTGSQYDDDLTVGMDEYDGSLQTGNVDLFEFLSDAESPISRLKELILSIDWEITDDILRQFNVELLDLKDIWANDKINLVYVQALEKISRYIYKEKANANPNSIKLLLRFYSNLEKIVSTSSMSESEKKGILMEDVEKFEKFKKQISRSGERGQTEKSGNEYPQDVGTALDVASRPADLENDDPLLKLKAIIFGMDWEITENELINLGEEVRNLEKRFSSSKAKLIILQGIAALGAYINLKKSNAHVDAFKLLHSFFLSLEKIVNNGLTGDEEKRVLLPEVDKFNAFKAIIAPTISPEAIAEENCSDEDDLTSKYSSDDEIVPAFADLPEDIHGFREDEGDASLDYQEKEKVDGKISSFFGDAEVNAVEIVDHPIHEDEENKTDLVDEMESRLNGLFGDESPRAQAEQTSEEQALKGVDVETEADDDSNEEALPHEGSEPAPALSENYAEIRDEEALTSSLPDKTEAFSPPHPDQTQEGIGIGEKETPVNVSVLLQGVDVETEADDDLTEEPLPFENEELAPALFAHDDVSEFQAEKNLTPQDELAGIEKRLKEFFGDDAEGMPGTSVPLVMPETTVVDLAEKIGEDTTGTALMAEDEFSPDSEWIDEPLRDLYVEDGDAPESGAFSYHDSGHAHGLTENAEDDFGKDGPAEEEEFLQIMADECEDHLVEFFEAGVPETPVEEQLGVESFNADIEDESVIFSAVDDTTASISGKDVGFDSTPERRAESSANLIAEEALNAPSVLQEDEDFIEYIEGVEFDEEDIYSVPEAASAGEAAAEVVFEAVDEDEITDTKTEEQTFIDEIEEEFNKYFIEQDDFQAGNDKEIKAANEGVESSRSSEIFGQSFEAVQELIPEKQQARGSQLLAVGNEPAFEKIRDELSQNDFTLFGTAGQKDESLSILGGCITSLGQGAESRILENLFNEISRLNSEWMDKPIEKTFLQLITIVAQFIDTHRFEASLEAYGLLLSVFNKLEMARIPGSRSESVQESILAETSKVLSWQQKMLIQKGNGNHDAARTAKSKDDGTVPGVTQDMSHKRAGQPSVDQLDAETVVRIVRNELEVLRQSLGDQIREVLRQQQK